MNDEKTPFIVGLTGNSGTGKGEIGKILRDFGVPVLDTDIVARRVVEKGTDCLKELEARFGAEIIRSDGTLDRKRLALTAFSTAENHCALNKITHHYIRMECESWICSHKGSEMVVLDAPMLYESGMDRICGYVVAVVASHETKLDRIIKRDHISTEEAEKRIFMQKKDNFFIENADMVIENNGEPDELRKQVENLYQKIREAVG